MECDLNINLLSKNKNLWNKSMIKDIFKMFRDFRNQGSSESKERCFVEFLIEIEQAYRNFLIEIRNLPMIMNCRVKGDEKSHFGGEECAKFMKQIRSSSEKYLNLTEHKDSVTENSVYNIILKMKEKASSDEMIARRIEKEIKENYNSMGTDDTLNFIKKSGYDLTQNDEIKENYNFMGIDSNLNLAKKSN